MPSFFDELKRRNVVRVGVAYVVVGWLMAQIAELVLPTFGAPDWVLRSMLVFIAIGLPFALLFAWAFELTPQGIKKTREVDLNSSLTHSTGRKLDFVIIGALVIALGYFLWERQGLLESAREQVADDAVATAGEAAPPASEASRPRSIAVLPFVNLSGDESQEWFADGLTEELLNSLVRTPDLLVSSRTSSFAYKNTDKPVPLIAEELGVDHILEGSVRRGGERLRVTAQLIRAADGFHLWSETYDRNLDDVIELQEEVAIAIAGALQTALDPEALAAMMSAGTHSVAAYEAYLEGLAQGVSIQAEGDIYEALGARDAYQRAVAIDPQFAKAWAELGKFWSIQLNSALIVSGITGLTDQEMQAQALHAFDKAIANAKDPVDELLYSAMREGTGLNFDKARRLITAYMEQRPNDTNGHIALVILLDTTRRYKESVERGLALIDRGSDDPLVMALILQNLRYGDDREQQRAIAERVMARYPDNVNLAYQAHRLLLYAGDVDGASRLVPRIENSFMPQSSRFLVHLRQACAERRVDDARRLREQYHVTREVPAEDELSIEWLSLHILGEREAATEVLAPLDNEDGLGVLIDFLGYGHFDMDEFPYLRRRVEGQGIRTEPVYEIPYRCKT